MGSSTPIRGAETLNTFSEELHLIPRWSIAISVFVFAAMQYVMWVIVPAYRHHPGAPLGFRIYFNTTWSVLPALYFLMVGYISRDSPRRGMNAPTWIILCLVLPGGIGTVLYFLLRQPVLSRCQACGTHVESAYHFCPQCAWQVSPCCGNCHRSTRITDLYCVSCGHDLATDNPPARLHAFSK
jgi:hypothetical protein